MTSFIGLSTDQFTIRLHEQNSNQTNKNAIVQLYKRL